MPGPIIQNPIPDWLQAQNASVTDSSLTKALRMIGHLIGADNPTTQVIGLMATDLPGEAPTGGLAKAVGDLWERAKTIRAFHGSPHDFEQFSTAKIGTGEGVQAYGHGLYFAENQQTAKAYQDTLSGRIPGGYSKPEDALVHASTDFRNHGYTKEQAIPELKKAYPWAADQHLEDAWNASNPGRMYEVAIKAAPEDFLDFDKPIHEQSPQVQEAFRKAGAPESSIQSSAPAGQWYQQATRNRYNAADLFQQGEGELGPLSPAQVSERLKSVGIPGIKYLDQGSRGWQLVKHEGKLLRGFVSEAEAQSALNKLPQSAEPRRVMKMPYDQEWAIEGQQGTTRNYVVFDDKLVDILKKYGIVLPAAGAASQMGPEKP